jgi:nitronate monooxygenase
MALASGGALAAACARAGALGLLGGGYGELAWLQTQHAQALQLLSDDAPALKRLGCGFITWKLDEDASALDWLLDQPHLPAALMLSFGDPRPYAERIAKRGRSLAARLAEGVPAKHLHSAFAAPLNDYRRAFAAAYRERQAAHKAE